MQEYLLGIDIGSGACKVTFLSIDNFSYTRTLSKEYKTYYPRPGWAEQDSADWLESAGSLIKEGQVLENIKPSEIVAVCLSGVTHSPVLLDAHLQVIGKVLHITDSRSISQSNSLKEYNEDFMKICFNSVSPLWTISMLKWISDEEPDRWQRVKKIIFPKDYIRFMLTQKIATDEIDAEGTLFFDPLRKKWIDEFARLIGLKVEYLPEILKPSDVSGTVTSEGEKWSGLKKGTPVFTGTTDTLLEILAAGNLKPGDCTVKLATFGRICVLSEKPVCGEGLITYSYIIPGMWYPGTGTKACASSYRWLREEFYRDYKKTAGRSGRAGIFEKMDRDAADISPGCDGLLFHPYLLGEGSPYNDSKLRGDFLGISLHHTRGHFARAVLEGTSFSLLDSINFIKSTGIKINSNIKFIGGGSTSRLWTEILADTLGYNAVVPKYTDASFGAAMLAGISAGLYRTVEEAVEKNLSVERTVDFNESNSRHYRQIFGIYRNSKECLTGIYHDLFNP